MQIKHSDTIQLSQTQLNAVCFSHHYYMAQQQMRKHNIVIHLFFLNEKHVIAKFNSPICNQQQQQQYNNSKPLVKSFVCESLMLKFLFSI